LEVAFEQVRLLALELPLRLEMPLEGATGWAWGLAKKPDFELLQGWARNPQEMKVLV
jgi:hypothetical protein